MTSGWSTPPRWSAAAPGRPPSARSWPGGPPTATAPATRAASGGCGCIWSAPCTACRSLFALTGAKADEREVLVELLAVEPELVAARPGQLLIADKNYYGRQFEAVLAELGVRLLRPARKGEPEPAGARLFKPLRQLIESVNDTFKGQLDLERHGGRTPAGVCGSGPAAHPGPDRRDLAQPPHRPAYPAITDRLRPLTPWNQSSRWPGGGRRSRRSAPSRRCAAATR